MDRAFSLATSRAPVGDTNPDEQLRLATFMVGGDLMAIDIMRIREIARPLPVTPVPRAPHGMIGVIDLRGAVLPLFDLRVRFDLPPRTAQEELLVRHLVIRLDGRTVGVVVDAMHDVVGVTRSQLRVGPGVLIGEAAEVFFGVCPVQNSGGDRLALLLNLRRLITRHDRLALNEILRTSAPLQGRSGDPLQGRSGSGPGDSAGRADATRSR